MCEASTASMASKHDSVPSSCGMLVKRLDTSMVTISHSGYFLIGR